MQCLLQFLFRYSVVNDRADSVLPIYALYADFQSLLVSIWVGGTELKNTLWTTAQMSPRGGCAHMSVGTPKVPPVTSAVNQKVLYIEGV